MKNLYITFILHVPEIKTKLSNIEVGHTIETDAKVEPTCTQTGLTKGEKCSVCNTILVKQEVTEKIPHSYENGVCTMH